VIEKIVGTKRKHDEDEEACFDHAFSLLCLLPFDAVDFRNLESPQLAAANYDQLPIFL